MLKKGMEIKNLKIMCKIYQNMAMTSISQCQLLGDLVSTKKETTCMMGQEHGNDKHI